MPSQAAEFKGIVHGKTIELEQELDLPDGEAITVMVRRTQPTPPPEEGLGEIPRAELWADRLVFDSSVRADLGGRILEWAETRPREVPGPSELERPRPPTRRSESAS